MDRRDNQFLEPERGPSLVGWAVKQLAVWSVGGFVGYTLLANHLLFQPSVPAPPRAVVAHVDSSTAGSAIDPAPAERPRPLGRTTLVTNSLTLRARSDGHVLVYAQVNGVRIPFIVDTGATWVSLTQADAVRAGVAGALNFSIKMNTANGVGKAAPVLLRQIRIGELEVDNVQGTVIEGQSGISLLGQSFLNRLSSYEMRDGVLTLSWQ